MVFGLIAAGLVLSPLGRGMSDQLTTAVLAFVGALVTFTATVIGFSVQRQAQVKQNRQFELDAAMRAGRLIAPEDGSSASPSALASGLVALTNLNQAELAVSLLVDLWSVRVADDGKRQDNDRCQVANEIAILVINGALSADCRNAQLMAAELLCRNATRLTATQSLHWPAVIDGCWREEFGKRTKLLLVEALVNMTTCPGKPANEAALRSVAVRLHGVSTDPEIKVKACVGKLIKALLPALKRCKSKEFAQGGVMVTIEQLIRAADYPPDNPDGYLSELSDCLAERLREWAEDATGIPTDPGCLATAG
ncbi:hypothetical protein Amsp01_003060 [Amycolatopsis sp. NBRC 101858]|nr:hypothetical protein Amsp01_003060 [Amycolatopsis sp. NBRC 101858]